MMTHIRMYKNFLVCALLTSATGMLLARAPKPTADVKKSVNKDSALKQPAAEPKKVTVAKKAPVPKLSPSLYLIDTIDAVIYTEEATDIITKSDVERIGLDGSERELEELIFAHLMYRDAIKFKMEPDEDTIDKHLKAMQRTHNLTLDQIKEMFTSAGYSYEEGRQELGMLNTINSVLDYKVRSRLLVPERDIIAYYEANPVMEPASYQLERAVALVSSDAQSKDELKAALLAGECDADLQWGEPFWVMEGDIAADKKFITTMAVGAISEPQDIKSGFEVFRLVESRPEHLLTMSDRSLEISNILRRPRYQQLMDEYKKQLLDNASIVEFKAKAAE